MVSTLKYLLFGLLTNPVFSFNDGFYNIVHMCNNIPSLDWAMTTGANAVEVDLQFHADGTPFKFFHTNLCDCSCLCHFGLCKLTAPSSVCAQLEKTSQIPCDANVDAAEWLQRAANKSNLALIWIDSKLTDFDKKMTTNTQKKAARKVIKLLENNLFKRGYKGRVLIEGPGFDSYEYIKEISNTSSSYKNQIHFTVGAEEMKGTRHAVDFKWNKNIFFAVGNSGCSPFPAASLEVAKLSAVNTVKGVFGISLTWTLNRKSSMEHYINYFNGIITNFPKILTEVTKEKNVRLAAPTDVIPASTSSAIETNADAYSCDCTYKRNFWSGGCKVKSQAPGGFACKCRYVFFSCKGDVVLCTDPESSECKFPGLTEAHCKEGRGDCDGY